MIIEPFELLVVCIFVGVLFFILGYGTCDIWQNTARYNDALKKAERACLKSEIIHEVTSAIEREKQK